jgi:hypothetical protein
MLAWLLQRWHRWSDKRGDFDEVFSRDHSAGQRHDLLGQPGDRLVGANAR